MSLPLLTLVIALGAEPIPPEKAAQIERAQQKAQAAVDAKYGNRKLSELSQDERRQLTRDRAEAEAKVLADNGVDAKQWARESLKKDRGAYADAKERVKALVEKEKADAEAAEKAKKASGEVQVQKGFSDENPVVLEEQEGGEPVVEKELPADVAADQAAAAEQDRLEGSPGETSAAPEAPAKGGRGKGKGGRGR